MAEPTDVPTRWREDDLSTTPAARRRRSLRRWTLSLAVLAALLVGAVVVFLSWLRPLPHAESVTLSVGPPDGLDREGLARETAALSSHPASGVLVVHVSGYAECRGGEVRLLPTDAQPGDAPNPNPSFRDLLRALAANPARHKLLILDLAAPPADVRRGILGDDVAAAVPADLEAVPDSARLTLCACSPGQVPAVMDDAGRSAFGYYVDRGLQGVADGAADGSRDRVITARELAAYVRGRVARWAWRCRGAGQTPQLYGPTGDFAVVAATGDAPAPEAAERPTAYPAWLLDGWKYRQQLWESEDYRIDPAAHHLVEALLLKAERDWFQGADEKVAANDLKADLDRLKKRLAAPPPADFPSLGAYQAQGRVTDPKTAESLRAALDPERLSPPPAGTAAPAAPLVSAETLAALKDKDPFDVAAAVFDAATENAPRADRLRVLDAVLRTQQPEPRYVETVLLRRLSELASRVGPADWPTETVRRALETARQGELVSGDLEDAPHARGRIEAAAQHCYEGGTLLLACRGYAPTESADRELEAAAEANDSARRSLDALRRARKTLDRALTFLTDSVPYLEWAGAPRKDWDQAVESACDLAAKISAPEPPDAPAAVRHNDELSQAIDDVETGLDRLRTTFSAGRVAQLRERLHRASAQASLLPEAEALLATPLLSAEDRAALWEATRALARRLHEETMRLDQAEDMRHEAVPLSPEGASAPTESQELASGKLIVRRASLSLSLLRLGGVGATEQKPAEDSLARAGAVANDPARFRPAAETLAADLAKTWADASARCASPTEDPAVRDRLSQVCLPADPTAAVAGPTTSPRADLRARDVREAREWRAGRARYESRDLAALGALPDWQARFYRNVARAAPSGEPETAVELHAEPATLQFGPSDAAVAAAVEVRRPGQGGEATLRFRTFADWFTLTATAPSQAPDADDSLRLPAEPSVLVPLRIGLHPEHDRAGAAPAGILAEVRQGGRTYHRLGPVSLRAVTDRLDVFVSADPSGAEPLDELRLRPLKGRQPYFLFVRNPSARPRNLTVQLSDGNGLLPGGAAKIALKEHETLPVRFVPEAPAPKAPATPPPALAPMAAGPPAEVELPELKSPLRVRVLDADTGDAVAADKTIPVEVALAPEYAQVTGVRFTPASADGGNRLAVTLRAAPGLSGPPCPVELVLPGPGPDGRRKAKKGTFEGELPADGSELTLFAEDIEPAPPLPVLSPGVGEGGEGEGLVFLNVDGRARAYVFGADFLLTGDAVTPRAQTRPALRLRAPAAAPSGPQFKVGIEVDNAPPGATLEVSLGRFNEGRFEADLVRRYPSGQRTRVGFSPDGPDGALAFDAAVSDWEAVFDAGRIVGRRDVRARLLDRDGAELRTVYHAVALDDGPPEEVRFVDAPKRARKDRPLALTAAGRSTSGVAQASFFLGKPVEGKPPPNAATASAHATDPDRTVWTAVLPLKADKAGPADVSVQFINAAGLSSFASIPVELTDGDPDKNDPGGIAGTVLEGTIPQPNLEVVLKDDKGAEKGRAKTKDDGKFVFEKVPPGAYSLTVTKSATLREGTAHVTVEPNKTVSAEIKLLMK